MPKPLSYRPEAVQEAEAARQWYEERSPSAAAAFTSTLGQALNAIAEHPGCYPVLSGSFRRFFLGQFPYLVIYRERTNDVEIVAVVHTSRRPGFWTSRFDG